jgi:3-methyl-2-oxobutanoate hydroxymethyltransferase
MSGRPPGPRPADPSPKSTVHTFRDKRRRGEPIVMVTAYDYPTARAADEAGVDAILVGDSLAMVVLGHPNTLSVTMDEMLHHARAVARGAQRPLLVGDLPFMSYQADETEAVRNAGRFLQAGMDAVKLEGGRALAPTAAAIARAGVPVMGHVGLTPQSIHALGGWKVQGRTADAARGLLEDALALEEAGCFALVLESMPDRLAAYVTERLSVPTIGIGAGPGTSGQVLVSHDLLGLFDRFTPKFVKRYAELGPAMREAFAAYRRDVETHAFPGAEHSYTMSEEEWDAFQSAVSRQPRFRKVGR